jgi:hypothetical protein
VICGLEQMVYDAVLTKYILLCVFIKNVTGRFHDQSEVICGLDQMIWVVVMT